MSWQSNNGRGRRPGNGAPPELEELFRHGQERFKRMVPGGGSKRGPVVFAAVALLALAAWTAYYTVPSDSVAVIQRFGKYLKEVPPGLHFKLPWGVESVTPVRVNYFYKEEFGFQIGAVTT